MMDGLDRVIDHGITVEEQLLYLASHESHTRLRNARLPRSASMALVRYLVGQGFLSEHNVPPDAQGSIVEYLLTFRGADRLQELRAERKR